MKREGRQHGMVKTRFRFTSTTISSAISVPKNANRSLIGEQPTAGIFIRAPSKPTNQSKFTGKCRRPRCSCYHLHPSSKSKEKTKGECKLRSSHADLGCGGFFLKLDGYSSSNVLDELDDYTDLENHGCEEDEE